MRERATQRGTRAWAATEFLAARMGLPSEAATVEARRFHEFEHYGFSEIARAFMRDAGIGAPADSRELFNRALSTTDFPKLLSDVVNKTLEHAYRYAPGTFTVWTARDTAPNFRPVHIARIAPPSELPELGESGVYEYLDMEEGEELAQVRTFGGLLALTRQALINDDLGALRKIGRALGMAAKMHQNRRVYKQLLGNPTLSDGTDVFHGDRGNLLTGAASALGRDSLALAVKTLRMMADGAGNPLSVEPRYLLVPPSLEITAHELCFSESIPGQANSAVPNLFKKLGLVPQVESLLESPALSGSSATAWYLMPDPNLWPVFSTITLGSEDALAPYVDSQPAWTSDGVEYKVRTDFDCCAVGCRAVKSAGQ